MHRIPVRAVRRRLSGGRPAPPQASDVSGVSPLSTAHIHEATVSSSSGPIERVPTCASQASYKTVQLLGARLASVSSRGGGNCASFVMIPKKRRRCRYGGSRACSAAARRSVCTVLSAHRSCSLEEGPWTAPLVFEWLLTKEGVRRHGEDGCATVLSPPRLPLAGPRGLRRGEIAAVSIEERSSRVRSSRDRCLFFLVTFEMAPSVDRVSFLPAAEACFPTEHRRRRARRCV
ncbi:hypothetical protein HPB50_007384 [Hyalomma asiaticum]|uniref:Uncharacterized protein n=1 Tax=Hyalomma asiaticum TaxID=266040 RepID=A0ACB7S3C8_HYAAI|nr:hypothetical protein HPB50_007384 [Hyalomma asiaticum]